MSLAAGRGQEATMTNCHPGADSHQLHQQLLFTYQ